MSLGSWEIEVNTDGMPQRVATAFSALDTMVGVEYRFLAYLGSQEVNGINHAVLAEQTVLTGKDTHNVVVLIFNEKPSSMEATLVNIERVVEGGAALGGIQIDPQFDIPEEAKQAFDNSFIGYVGAKVKLVALLATKVTKGTNYIFVATFSPVVPDPEDSVALVMVNGMTNQVAFADLLNSKMDNALGYAFTW
jgi:hypothetical protein